MWMMRFIFVLCVIDIQDRLYSLLEIVKQHRWSLSPEEAAILVDTLADWLAAFNIDGYER